MNKKGTSNVWKNLFWAAISFLIAIFTIHTVMRETKVFSIRSMIKLLSKGSYLYILLAMLCMLLFIYLEGQAIRHILIKLSYSVKHREGFLYSSADIYFSAITPSASGGQPASLFFMLRDGISITDATLCLVYNLMMYNASIVVIAIISLVFRFDLFLSYIPSCKALIAFGCVILTALMIGFYFLLSKSKWLMHMGTFVIDLLLKFHILKNETKWKNSLENKIHKYEAMSKVLFEDKRMALTVFLLNLFQRMIQISIAPLVFLGLGGSFIHVGSVWFTQAFSTIGSNCIPVPGAMGVVDYLLINGFGEFMSAEMAVHTEMLARGVSFYICIVVSLITIFFGYIRRERGRLDK